jgi:hypothetical protein
MPLRQKSTASKTSRISSHPFVLMCVALRINLRLHANLGYVCSQTESQSKSGGAPHPPSYVTAPPNMPQLEAKYSRLRTLFAGWTGKDGQRRSMSNGATNASTPIAGFGN